MSVHDGVTDLAASTLIPQQFWLFDQIGDWYIQLRTMNHEIVVSSFSIGYEMQET